MIKFIFTNLIDLLPAFETCFGWKFFTFVRDQP